VFWFSVLWGGAICLLWPEKMGIQINRVNRNCSPNASPPMSTNTYSSPTLELITKVREARTTKPPTETYRIALESLTQAASLGTGSQGLLLLLLKDIFEDAIFSSDEYSSSSSTNQYNKVAHCTISSRMQQKSDWAEQKIERLTNINKELQEQNEMAKVECTAAREELAQELNRRSNAALKIDFLEDKLHSHESKTKKKEEETHQNFVVLSNHSNTLACRLERSQLVVQELAAYRDKLESVRVRFRRLTIEDKAGELQQNARPAYQIKTLVEQLKGLYYDLYSKFEILRTNVCNTKEHIHNMKKKFSTDAGQLIQEKERLTLHSRNELVSDEVKKLRYVTGDMHEKQVVASLERLKLSNYGLWVGYVKMCELFMQDKNTSALNAVNPPTWPHPLPSHETVHQDILAIYNSVNPNHSMQQTRSGPLPTCVRSSQIESYLDNKYISFSDVVVNYFLSQYDNKRIAIASFHSFLKKVLMMKKIGSTRIEMFVRAVCGNISIFSIWSYLEARRCLSDIKTQLMLRSEFDRRQAVDLLYGDFASVTEMVDVENHLTVHVQTFIRKETEMGAGNQEEKEHNANEGNKGNEGTSSKKATFTDYEMLMEFLCGQLISGTELRINRSLGALSARDLINSGTMRLTRFQDAVVGMWTRKKKISRKQLTRLYHIVIFEAHGETLFDYINRTIATKNDERQKSGLEPIDVQYEKEEIKNSWKGNTEGQGASNTAGSHEGTTPSTISTGNTKRVNSIEAMKYLMGREVTINNELAQVLAFLTWTMVPKHQEYKHAMDEFAEETSREAATKELEEEKLQKQLNTMDASKGSKGLSKVNQNQISPPPTTLTVATE